MTAIIFLDIDGVCNSAASCRAAWPGHITVDPEESKRIAAATLDRTLVARVQRICDATGARIVIVSGWRRWMSLDEIRSALAGIGLTAPVIDAVPCHFSGDGRAAFSGDWLDDHPEVTRWVVIDDTRDHWRGWPSGRLVHPADGITDANADCAIAVLEAP